MRDPDDQTKSQDLSDPAVLRAACEELAEGMRQQANAANHRNAFQGHPQPAFFFGRAATVLAAAARYVAGDGQTPPADAKTEKPRAETAKK